MQTYMTTRTADRTDSAMTVLLDPHRAAASYSILFIFSSASKGSIVDRDADVSAWSLKSRTNISRLKVISSSVSYVWTLRRFLPHDSMFSRPTPQITCWLGERRIVVLFFKPQNWLYRIVVKIKLFHKYLCRNHDYKEREGSKG